MYSFKRSLFYGRFSGLSIEDIMKNKPANLKYLKENQTVQVSEAVWINPWVKPAPDTSQAHTHSYSEGYTPPNELKCINRFVADPSDNLTPIGWVKQEGITPMRYDANTASAVASISVPSDEQKKIDYLNDRARTVYHERSRTLRPLFNMDGPSKPRYYKELIDAIKNGEYEIDEKQAKYADEAWEDFKDSNQKWFDYNVFDGINFTKFPAADLTSYYAAEKELDAEFQAVKDVIAIMPAEEALARIQAFEKWVPSNAPTKQ